MRGVRYAAPMKPALARWAAILFLLAAGTAQAAFYFVREGQVAHLGAEISYRVEEKAGSSFEAVSRDTSGWTTQKEKPYAGSGKPNSLWVRFDIPSGISLPRVLVNIPLWEHEEYFVVRDGRLVQRLKAGVSTPWSERATHVTMAPVSAGGFVPIDLAPGTRTTVYARLSSEGRVVAADIILARLWDPERVLDAERNERIVQGIFFGVLFFLIVYNLGLYFAVREPSFLYYVLLEAGFAATWATISGLSFEYLFPAHPAWESHSLWIGSAIGGFGGVQFLRHYLGTPRGFPRMDRFLKVWAYVSLALLPLTFLPLSAGALQNTLTASAPIGAAGLIAVTAVALKHRHPAAMSVLLAMTCIGLGAILFAGAASGWWSANNFTMHAGQIGSALGGIILSIGLGVRLQDERTRLARLKRFLSPKVSELIAAGQLDDPLATRRREVTILFVDLRGFTAFSETAAPEDVLGVLREYHAEIGKLVDKYEGTIEHFAGDSVMIIFNDPAPLPDPALAAVGMAVELRDNVAGLAETWRKVGHELACGLGIAQGFATIGTIGFPGRQDYGVIGAVNNLAARLCAQATAGQVLVSQRVFARVEERVVAEPVGELVLKGIHAPVLAYNVVAMRSSSAQALASAVQGELGAEPATAPTSL